MVDYNAGRRFIKARPNTALYGINPGRAMRIRGLMLHSTRSGKKDNDDGPGTENYFGSASNPGGYSDMLFGGTGQQVRCTHWMSNEEPRWCAGKGEAGTWSTQDYFIQCEVSQGTIDSEFTEESIESLCQFTAEQAVIHGFPIRRIEFLNQRGPCPYGIADHANCANGVLLGKSDVGPLFPWTYYLARSNEILKGDNAMTPEEVQEFNAMKSRLASLEGLLLGTTGTSAITAAATLADRAPVTTRLNTLEEKGDQPGRAAMADHIANHAAGLYHAEPGEFTIQGKVRLS